MKTKLMQLMVAAVLIMSLALSGAGVAAAAGDSGAVYTLTNSAAGNEVAIFNRAARARVFGAELRKGERVIGNTDSLGYNYRMTDIQAAVGREQVKRLPDVLERRRGLARRYLEGLAGVPGLRLPDEPPWARSNWQSFCVRLADQLDQRAVMQRLLDDGISTRRGVMCAHREASYPAGTWTCRPEGRACDCGPGGCRRLAESERAQDQGLLLPLFHQLTDADQDRVIAALRRACA